METPWGTKYNGLIHATDVQLLGCPYKKDLSMIVDRTEGNLAKKVPLQAILAKQ